MVWLQLDLLAGGRRSTGGEGAAREETLNGDGTAATLIFAGWSGVGVVAKNAATALGVGHQSAGKPEACPSGSCSCRTSRSKVSVRGEPTDSCSSGGCAPGPALASRTSNHEPQARPRAWTATTKNSIVRGFADEPPGVRQGPGESLSRGGWSRNTRPRWRMRFEVRSMSMLTHVFALLPFFPISGTLPTK